MIISGYLANYYRAIMLDTEEEYDQLIDALSRVLLNEPGHQQALNNRAVAFWEIGDVDQAIRDLSNAIHNGQSPVPLMNRADILIKLERSAEALHDYSAAIQIEPANPYFWRSRAHALHRLGRYSEAVADYDAAIQLQPQFHRTHSDRAKALTHTQLDTY